MEDEITNLTIFKNLISLIVSMISANFFLLMISLYKRNTNKIKSQEYALLVGFGVGLSWGLCLIKKC